MSVNSTAIPGLLVIDLAVHGDNRGWFKENWQREKMLAAGVPDFGPVQNNVSYNAEVGTTRGIHAEPWDKLVSVVHGRVFGAWVDLREGPTFGRVVTHEVGPGTTVFVPRGVGNSYQTLEPDTVYSYLVNDHWSAEASYTFVNLADPTIAVDWPIPLGEAILSEKDRAHPVLSDVVPMAPRKVLVTGANGQLGRALRLVLPGAEFADRDAFDLDDPESVGRFRWRDYEAVINAAAYTRVDEAETPAGRAAAWQANVAGVARLAAACAQHGVTLVHVSSDYVFDGSVEEHREDEPFSPLGVYGQTKAAGDALVSTVPRHYVVRTSWVVGDGANFVRTMADLADRGIAPKVVADQYGRLTFTDDLARGIRHLLETRPPYGVYNLTSRGAVSSWAEIAADVYERRGRSRSDVTGVSSEDYFAGRSAAPRPKYSTLSLEKLERSGFVPADGAEALTAYLAQLER